MKGFKLNPDRKSVNTIMDGLARKDGHCPCRINVDDTTLCPCDEFINDGICKCKLYIPIVDDTKKEEKLTTDNEKK